MFINIWYQQNARYLNRSKAYNLRLLLQLAKERQEELSRQASVEAEKNKPRTRKEEVAGEVKPTAFKQGVGKYINPTVL